MYLITEKDDGLDVRASFQDSNDLGGEHGELGFVKSTEVKRAKGCKIDSGINRPQTCERLLGTDDEMESEIPLEY